MAIIDLLEIHFPLLEITLYYISNNTNQDFFAISISCVQVEWGLSNWKEKVESYSSTT